jgi:putative intracellular protease/amidase
VNDRSEIFFATNLTVDGNIVTGQNQNASDETAQKLLSLLQEKKRIIRFIEKKE